MHGVDWPAMRKKYAALLSDVAVRSDLNRVIQWMSSELSVGHHAGGGGDRLETPKTVPGGLLGADYSVENGRYRFKKVYGGLNWNPQLRAPLTEPGVNVRAGEYLLAVRGQRRAPAGQRLQLLREHVGQDRRDHRRPERRRHRLAHRAGRADRERERAAESRLGRGQPAQGRRRDRRARGLRLCAEHRASPATPTSSATSIRRRTRTRSSSTSASTAAARSPTTTSTCCGGR